MIALGKAVFVIIIIYFSPKNAQMGGK